MLAASGGASVARAHAKKISMKARAVVKARQSVNAVVLPVAVEADGAPFPALSFSAHDIEPRTACASVTTAAIVFSREAMSIVADAAAPHLMRRSSRRLDYHHHADAPGWILPLNSSPIAADANDNASTAAILNVGLPPIHVLSEHAPPGGRGHLSLPTSSQHIVAFDNIMLDPASFPSRFVIDIEPATAAPVHLCFVPHDDHGPGHNDAAVGPQVVVAATIHGTPGEKVTVVCHVWEGGGRVTIIRGDAVSSEPLGRTNRLRRCVHHPALHVESLGGRFAAAMIENDGTVAAAS
jgi:hypothetical protein